MPQLRIWHKHHGWKLEVLCDECQELLELRYPLSDDELVVLLTSPRSGVRILLDHAAAGCPPRCQPTLDEPELLSRWSARTRPTAEWR